MWMTQRRIQADVNNIGNIRPVIGLILVFQVLAQFGARAVDLVTADEVRPDAVSEGLDEDVDRQLTLSAPNNLFPDDVFDETEETFKSCFNLNK
jgi:hypothetical protein